MSDIKSPYLVTRHEIYLSDEDTYYPDLQKKVLFRAAKMPVKKSRWDGWWDFAITVAFWGSLGCFLWWIGQLGFWDWIRGWF
jgi:hypothetical protein